MSSALKPIDTSGCLAHVLVCVNRRHDSRMPFCAQNGAEEVYGTIRSWLEDEGLLTRIWLTRTECMGWCTAKGTTVAIYPQGIWYRGITPPECHLLIERHLAPLKNSP